VPLTLQSEWKLTTTQLTKFCLDNSQKLLRSIAYFITVNVRFITVNIDRTVKLF